MGLGTVKESDVVFLGVAGGHIWDRKAGEESPHYGEQEWTNSEGEVKVRKGARYSYVQGNVVKVEFKEHDKFGENINVTLDTEDGERYVLSAGLGNRNSQDIMKGLLVADLDKPIMFAPYDFADKQNSAKRVQGITVKQDGEKLDLKLKGVPTKEKEWWGTATKKQKTKFFDELNEWFQAEIEEMVIPALGEMPKREPSEKEAKPAAPKKDAKKAKDEAADEEEASKELKKENIFEKKNRENKESEAADDTVKTPLQMKKAIKAYISENYPDKEIPATLKGEELIKWYQLTLTDDELPFEEDAEEENEEEVDEDDIESELNKLLPK